MHTRSSQQYSVLELARLIRPREHVFNATAMNVFGATMNVGPLSEEITGKELINSSQSLAEGAGPLLKQPQSARPDSFTRRHVLESMLDTHSLIRIGTPGSALCIPLHCVIQEMYVYEGSGKKSRSTQQQR